VALRGMRIWRYIDEVAKAGSVRQAADRVNITPSALLRRIQDVEHDLGTPVFERHPSGMRLTAAGELLLGWMRSQDADLRQVYSQIAALSGLQRGEVSIACSQASQGFVADQVNVFLRRHPNIKFSVNVTDHRAAQNALIAFQCDIAIIFQPFDSADVSVLASVDQDLVAVMAHDHPLASRATVRLGDCGQYGVALSNAALGGREQLEELLRASTGKINVVYESNSFAMLPNILSGTQIIGFHLAIGALDWHRDSRLAIRPLVDSALANRPIILGQLKGRTLPVASAKFAEQVRHALADHAK
jgi:DNA-binding transcriptional LysR family regulator